MTSGDLPTCTTISLSGGGYRAAVFGSGTLLAIADSPLAETVVSISSVSGGSIASALTIGGFGDEDDGDAPTAMERRVRNVAGIVQTSAIPVQLLARWAMWIPIWFGMVFALLFLFPRSL